MIEKGKVRVKIEAMSGQYGIASWYGPPFHGRLTANGEIYDMSKLTAAHKELPFNTRVRVTNLDNGKSVVVRINDRGPFVKGRIIDLSKEAARMIDMVNAGISVVELSILGQ
ncbi:TPA: septal ring lytic transglycosylase RlpA family protein [Candidatus Poribacteria bacterium]|nr:septal ring lytic transglycosylase RlpA family protein [Candidatus Poribacteria bacterium]